MSANKNTTVKSFVPSGYDVRTLCKTIVTPAFYQTFECIGQACENHCCQHWMITVDKPTYKKYKKHGDIRIRQVANKQTKSCGQGGVGYRQIKLQANGDCPFLDPDKLCHIHRSHGEEMLPSICQKFPRDDKLVHETLFTNLSISCPEAARKILLDDSAMSLEHSDVTNTTKLPAHLRYFKLSDIQLQQQFKQVAYNCILAENSDTVEGRLFNLAFLFRMTSQRIAKGEHPMALLNSFDDLITSGGLNDLYQQTNSGHKVQEFVLHQLLQVKGYDVDNAILVDYKNQVIDYLRQSDAYNSKTEQIDLSDFYAKHCQRGYEKLVDSHGFSFINLMLHWVYGMTFDFVKDNGNSLFNGLAIFILKFFYIRSLCGVLLSQTDNPSKASCDALLVGIVHSISRKSDHDVYCSELVYEKLIEQGLAQPEHILGLIKV